MSGNSINLLLAGGVLLLVSACFCRSDQAFEPEPDRSSNRATNVTSSPAGKQPSKSSSEKPDNGDFVVEHMEVTTPKYLEIDRQVKNERLLEDAAAKLNKALALPDDITLRTKDCQEINAFYDPGDRSITMCYELMEHFYNTFRSDNRSEDEAYDRMFEAVRFVFLHEIAHALIDQYKLPIIGNEEDAADRCSAYINLEELGDVKAVLAAADAFAIESKNNAGKRRNLADEHLLGEQRFYNSLCMIYGSDTTKHDYIVSKGYLPKERAVRCPSEYQRTVDSWVNLLGPWRKN